MVSVWDTLYYQKATFYQNERNDALLEWEQSIGRETIFKRTKSANALLLFSYTNIKAIDKVIVATSQERRKKEQEKNRETFDGSQQEESKGPQSIPSKTKICRKSVEKSYYIYFPSSANSKEHWRMHFPFRHVDIDRWCHSIHRKEPCFSSFLRWNYDSLGIHLLRFQKDGL